MVSTARHSVLSDNSSLRQMPRIRIKRLPKTGKVVQARHLVSSWGITIKSLTKSCH